MVVTPAPRAERPTAETRRALALTTSPACLCGRTQRGESLGSAARKPAPNMARVINAARSTRLPCRGPADEPGASLVVICDVAVGAARPNSLFFASQGCPAFKKAKASNPKYKSDRAPVARQTSQRAQTSRDAFSLRPAFFCFAMDAGYSERIRRVALTAVLATSTAVLVVRWQRRFLALGDRRENEVDEHPLGADAPEELLCPIGGTVMLEPVLCGKPFVVGLPVPFGREQIVCL